MHGVCSIMVCQGERIEDSQLPNCSAILSEDGIESCKEPSSNCSSCANVDQPCTFSAASLIGRRQCCAQPAVHFSPREQSTVPCKYEDEAGARARTYRMG